MEKTQQHPLSAHIETERVALTNRPLLLGLCAPAMGSGKTTFADYLVSNHGFQHVRFATILKDMALALFEGMGINPYDARELITDTELKETPLRELGGKSPRYVMQTLGTEWGRDLFGVHFWADLALVKARSLMACGHNVVIDDTRFTNEADTILDNGGRMVRIIRPGTKRPEGSHTSEGELDDYPCFAQIVNHSTPSVLYAQADNLVRDLRRIQSY